MPPTSGKSSAPVKGDALALGQGVCVDLGCPQVQASLVPPKRDAGNAWDKALSDCNSQLHNFRQRLAKQRTAVSNALEALDRSHEKLTGLEDEVAKLDLRYRELSVDPLTPSSSKVASEVGDGPHLEEVQSCTDGMDLTGHSGDADPPEPPVGSPSPGPDRHPPSAPIAPFVQNEDASKRCLLRRRSRMIRCAQLIAWLCDLYGSQLRAS